MATPVTVPKALTVATLVAEDVQLATLLMNWCVPSLKLPTALSASVEPRAMPAVDGVSVIEVRVAELTFNGTVPVTPPKAAEMLVVPPPTAVAAPMLPDALLMVATPVALLVQVTSWVMFWVLASLNVPMAVKLCRVSGAIVREEGATAMVVTVAFVTLRVTLVLIEFRVAVMVVEPGLTA